jgi:hypothetical protein
MPSKQILETIQAKITRKEFDSTDMNSLKNMINGKNAVDKLGNNDSGSDSEEPQKGPVKQKKKKQKKSDFVTTEDISVIINEAVINAMEERKTKWCSHCKYEKCFDKNGKKKADWHKFIADKAGFENHFVGECTGKWCGKCKDYEHAYSECKSKSLNQHRS